MTAKEARDITNAAKFPNIDSEDQLISIGAMIDIAAKKGEDRITFIDLTDENKKALIVLGYSVSYASKTNVTIINW